jgi:RHS repeat-associated protein
LTLPATESYSFDGTGNRNLTGGGSSSATGTHNQVQNDGTYTYTYDNEGNQLTRTSIATGAVTEYEWDYRNRLVEVIERPSAQGAATSVVTFHYDAFDRRTTKEVDSDANGTCDRAEAWVWEGDQVVLQLEDADGAGAGAWKLTNRYLYGDMVDLVLADEQLPNGGIALSTPSPSSGTVLWPLADHLGSVRDLVDSNGVIREHVVYDSFGNRLSESDFDANGNAIASTTPAAVDHLFGYTGREWDRDVGLQYNRARWYDPAQGRWISQDPIGFSAGDANLYRYVGNEATGATDPTGLRKIYIQIVYYFEKLTLTPAIRAEVDRIFQDAMSRCGGSEHSIYIVWTQAGSPASDPIEQLSRDQNGDGGCLQWNRWGSADDRALSASSVSLPQARWTTAESYYPITGADLAAPLALVGASPAPPGTQSGDRHAAATRRTTLAQTRDVGG